MNENILKQVNRLFNLESPIYTQFCHEEDGEPYQVWKVETEGKVYILKEAKEYEAEVYQKLLTVVSAGVPKVFDVAEIENQTYLLMEYIQGENLRKCTRRTLTLALDTLIEMQNAMWENKEFSGIGNTFDISLNAKTKQKKYLKDPELEAAYDKFLEVYSNVPRTLCHHDLLPFNILVSENRAVLIDWEYAGILPYPTAFARLIAHGEESESAFFHMTQEDKEFAIDYYFKGLLQDKGIPYEVWLRTLDYFLFKEYCEWVMIGHQYGDTELEYYKKYLPIAKAQAKKLLGYGVQDW